MLVSSIKASLVALLLVLSGCTYSPERHFNLDCTVNDVLIDGNDF